MPTPAEQQARPETAPGLDFDPIIIGAGISEGKNGGTAPEYREWGDCVAAGGYRELKLA